MGPRSISEETNAHRVGGTTREEELSVLPAARPVPPVLRVTGRSNQIPSTMPAPAVSDVAAGRNRQHRRYPIIHLESFYTKLHQLYQHWYKEGSFKRDDGWSIARLEQNYKHSWRQILLYHGVSSSSNSYPWIHPSYDLKERGLSIHGIKKIRKNMLV